MHLRPYALAAVVAASAAVLDAAPAAAAPAPWRSHTCPNGLELLVVEDHALPLVTVEIAAKNGSMTEPPEYNGLSHLYEHMFFKANQAIPNQEQYLQRAHELGMVWNGTTATERVNYFFTTTSDHLHDSLVFMRDAIVSPLFDAKELERERVVVTGEIDRNEANPYYHLMHEVNAHAFYRYPSRKDPLGNRKTVLSATPEKMRTIQKRYYIPNNSVLVVTGDVSPEKVITDVDQLFSKWQKGDDPFKKYPLVHHPALKKRDVVVIEQKVQTFTGEIVWHGPSTVGPTVSTTYAADVLGTACDEPSSKFQKDLVDSGACVSAGLSWFTQSNTGPITLRFEATPDKVDACVRAVAAELPKMRQPGYLSDDEMRNAAHTIEVAEIQERERPSQYAHTLTFWWTSAGLDYYTRYVDNLKAVKQADVARYLDTFVEDKPFVFGALVSPEMTKQGMNKAHFEKVFADAFDKPAAAA
ncbi:MAG TPA: pitrilysin family protein, partial [Minicystis sp.]|nr:pitrilysin family protein [Minicystis sp.]